MSTNARHSIVALRAHVPETAFTANTLGTLREGSGAVINDEGLIVTIGYLITEAEEVWLTTHDERVLPAHVVAYDQETGFGLVQAMGDLDLPALRLGSSTAAKVRAVGRIIDGEGDEVVNEIVAKQEFAGYWEYMLEEALFTAPYHPSWGGAALLDENDNLIGIGSLRLQMLQAGDTTDINMVVPIDLLKPILDDLVTRGQARREARPWLGVFSAERNNGVVVMNVSDGGPAEQAGLKSGDVISELDGEEVEGLGDFYRKLWSKSPAGSEFALRIVRSGRESWLRVKTADRNDFLSKPPLQ
ncbi:S1C family serine protease [Devosia sp.]|uniref:S1C family serine protease n=1 Tax=Devosia sp. TaxID=1871048 RepID=UPI0025D7E67F|nr:S1C family serine protease [Devosia sp.]MCR6635777.1 S1C family serine protease [Devosia sp.]